MAEQKDIDYVISRFFSKKPGEFSKKFSEDNAGINFVLKILDDAGTPLSAGEISKRSCVSTARVAVLIKKMQDKGLIKREEDENDRRKALVSITEKGSSEVRHSKELFIKMVGRLIDEIGIDEIKQFFMTSEKIARIAGQIMEEEKV